MKNYNVGDVVRCRTIDMSEKHGAGIIIEILTSKQAAEYMRSLQVSYKPYFVYKVHFQNNGIEYCLHEEIELL